MFTHSARLVLVSGILLLALLTGLTPPAVAQDATDWSTPVVVPKAAGAVVSNLFSASQFNSDNIGVAYAYSTNTGFSLWDGATWASKNADVSAATTCSVREVIGMGGLRWGILADCSGVGNFYASTDDGTTWSLEETGMPVATQTQMVADGVGGVYHVVAATSAQYSHSADYGTTWAAYDVISDNRGTFGVAGSASLTVQSATLSIGLDPFRLDSYMVSTGDNAAYYVSSSDGSDWSVPYTNIGGTTPVDGGTVKLPIPNTATFCPGAIVSNLGAADRIETDFTNDVRASFLVDGPGAVPIYSCQVNQQQGIPSTTPTNSIVLTSGRVPNARNEGGAIMAYGETGTTNEAYVYFLQAGASSYVLSYTATDVSTGLMDVSITDTQGYFVYTNQAFAGRIEEVHASIFDPPSPSGQVAVTDLTGYSMDNSGVTILVRTDNGDTVESYAVDDIIGGSASPASTVATADCSADGIHYDGVNSANFNSGTDDRIYLTYVDCSGDGDSDAFRIREGELGTFPTYGCNEATGNIDNNAQIIIPENLGEIGTISDLNPSYAGRCSDDGLDDAAVGFSFSTVGTLAEGGGKIGTVAFVYNEGVLTEDFTDTDLETISSTSPPVVNQFCSWTDQGTGKDYLGGVGAGPSKVFEIISSVHTDPTEDGLVPDVELTGQFSNSGLYGSAEGIACQGDSIVILKSTQVHFLDNVSTSSEDIVPGWPKTISGVSEVRGAAITGSGRFLAYVDGCSVTDTYCESGEISVYARNGTKTGSVPVPTGTWRGMEFDNSGEHLAVFTNDYITVYDTSEVTCVTTGTCATDGGQGDGDVIDPDDPDPDEEDCTGPFCVTDPPEGFTPTLFKLFLGVILMLGIAFGMYSMTGSAVMGIMGAVGGFLLAFAFGLIPLWVIVALVVIAVAVIFIRTKSAAT